MKTIVVGGGATGLALGYLLSRAGQSVQLVEASDRAGGLMNTFDVGDGSRLEYFYHHFFTHDAEINWLIDELGLGDSIRFVESTMSILRNGQFFDFNGLKDLLRFKAMGLLGRFRFGLTSALLAYMKRYAKREDRTALDWFYSYAGRDATDSIWKPMLEVKFGDAADKIPLAWIASRLRQRVRSRKSGVEKLGYLKGSLQVLTDRLIATLENQGVAIGLRKQVAGFRRIPKKGIELSFSDGTAAIGDRVIFTIPTCHLSPLFRSHSLDYARRLSEIKYLGAICTVLSFSKQLSSTYWTNIADGECDFGGVIEQTNLVPNSWYGGQNIVYLSKYAMHSDSIWKDSDDQLIERQLRQLGRVYGRDLKEDLNKAWVFRSKTAAPVTDMGFRDRVPGFQTPVPDVYMASMCHLYPEERSVNNSIRVAAELLHSMGEHEVADQVPRGISIAGEIGHEQTAAMKRAA